MKTFRIEVQDLAEGDLDALSEVMSEWQDEMVLHIRDEATKLGISYSAAADVVYLRTRSRWTQEKEDHLISLAREGKPLPDVLSGEF